MKEQNHIGYFVKSLAGHDKDKIYVIMREDNEYVYLADGIYHKIENPKRKNKKHIQLINKKWDLNILDEKIYDHHVKRAIKMLNADNE